MKTLFSKYVFANKWNYCKLFYIITPCQLSTHFTVPTYQIYPLIDERLERAQVYLYDSTGVPYRRFTYRLNDRRWTIFFVLDSQCRHPTTCVCVCVYFQRSTDPYCCQTAKTAPTTIAFARIVVMYFFSFNCRRRCLNLMARFGRKWQSSMHVQRQWFRFFLYFLFSITGSRLLQSSSFIVINKWLLPLYGYIYAYSCTGKRYMRP